MDRRSVLRIGGATIAGAGALSFLFTDRASRAEKPSRVEPSRAEKGRAARGRRKGELKRDPRGVLDLPEGFSYWIVDKVFDPMGDGYRVPARPDGMGCFPHSGHTLALLRNHEVDYNPMLSAFRDKAPPEAFDPRAAGGVTRVIVDPRRRRALSSNLVLCGTARNCGGGVSPWGWISCEETTDTGHGYAFLCRADAGSVQPPRILKGYGRFRHEAACVDPATHIAYLTEDQIDGCLYRFVPRNRDEPFEGRLEAMRVVGRPRASLSSDVRPGRSLEVEWVPLEQPTPERDTLREEARAKGACTLARGEGIWFSNGIVAICSTSGGRARRGQLLALDLGHGRRPDRLRLIVESPGEQELDMPDNISVTSWGDVYMAEDGGGDQYIRGVTPQGRLFDVARNAKSSGEFAGVCFSPDEGTLFFNMQVDGLTVAVTGPFSSLGAAAG